MMAEFERISSATRARAGCFLMFDTTRALAPDLDERIFPFDLADLGALGFPLYADGNVVPGSTHYPLILFARSYPDYDYYWLIENDVRFTGDWAVLFDHFDRDGSDLVTAHLRTWSDEPYWNKWHLARSGEEVDSGKLLRSFNPIFRISAPALRYMEHRHAEGWVGHQEVFMPSLLSWAGFRLRDFGGRGRYVREGDCERFYLEPDLLQDKGGHVVEGTVRFRPPFPAPGPVANKLYHPVKSPVILNRENRIAELQIELASVKARLNQARMAMEESGSPWLRVLRGCVVRTVRLLVPWRRIRRHIKHWFFLFAARSRNSRTEKGKNSGETPLG